jgi:serine/threonine-protein kinase
MEGNAKDVDFGIAKATARGDGKTKTGTVKGKVAYLAPEQVLGKPLDKRVDVFACGIVMVETFVNKNPFRGDTEFASLQNIVHGEMPTLASLRPDIPEVLEPIARKALARDPDERYPSCHALLIDLEAAAKTLGIAFSHPQVHEYLEREKATFEAELAPGEEDGYLSTVASQPSMEILQLERDAQPHIEQGEVSFEESTAFFRRLNRRWVAPVSVVASLIIVGIAFFTLQLKNGAPAMRPPVALPEETGIEILSIPTGADVLLDGQLYSGKTPLRIGGLNPKRSYQVELRLAGYANERTQVALEQTGWRTVQLALASEAPKSLPVVPTARIPHGESSKPRKHEHEPAPVVAAAPTGQGKARFIVQPWASVTIDGERIGDTPMAPQMLRAGPHTIVLSNSETGKSITKKIEIGVGQELVIRENLDK